MLVVTDLLLHSILLGAESINFANHFISLLPSLKPGGSIPEKGRKLSLHIKNRKELSRDVIKSDTATVEIPEVELELAAGTLGGLVTTVEGLVSQVSESLGAMEKRFCTTLSSGTLPAISPPHTLQDGERCLLLEELLPGIQNHITLDKIASKLSWKDFHVLSSVSRCWHHAIQNRHVYDVRVRLQSRETLALIYGNRGGYSSELTLYSTRDRSCYRLLPNLSNRNEGIRLFNQCVTVDGKIYVLGGRKPDRINVYMLDLAGQRQWTQCASMRHPISSLKCTVINGKIFAFGNRGRGRQSREGEVYDPKENTWSPIKTMPIETMSKFFRHLVHTVEVLGHELFHCGYTLACPTDRSSDSEQNERPECALYNPVKDEWRDFKHFDRENEFPFVAHGRLHSMGRRAIYVHDVDSHSWSQLHTFPLDGVDDNRMDDIDMDGNILFPISARAVEDELLVLMNWYEGLFGATSGFCLLQSKGFGGDKEEIQWEKVPVDFTENHYDSSTLCPVSLLEL